MYQSGLVEQSQSVQKLLCKHSNKCCAEAPKLVLFDKLIEVDTKQLENKTEMLSMDEGVLQTQKVVIIIFIELGVEL